MDSVEEAKKYIYSIDFSMVIDKMVEHNGWFRDDALETCEFYRNYLFLIKKYDNMSLPPSEDIDEMWHNHILDTNKYIEDCKNIFGTYLHHYPYFGIDKKTNLNDLDNAFKNTQDLHYQEFKKYITPTRSRFPKMIYYIARKLSKE
jgi:hypothetical protein